MEKEVRALPLDVWLKEYKELNAKSVMADTGLTYQGKKIMDIYVPKTCCQVRLLQVEKDLYKAISLWHPIDKK